MAYDQYLSTATWECPFIDGMTMYDMPDDDYREYAQYGVFSVDHHGALRFEGTAQIIAANREQFDILVEELVRLRDRTDPRTRAPRG